MATLAGRNTRTLTGYVITMLEHPRWIIERDVDFSDCHLRGEFDSSDSRCTSCRFGTACRWLTRNLTAPPADAPFSDLLQALDAAVHYVRNTDNATDTCTHSRDCECETCLWLREALSFLRTHRRRK